MARALPKCPEWVAENSQQESFKTETFLIHVITPIFGGGAETRKNEPLGIRGSTVRGHLRFWWRATKGTSYADHRELKKAEEQIWGSASIPSQIQIAISIVNEGKLVRDYSTEKAMAYPKYALFPFQKSNTDPVAECREGIQFNLTIRYPSNLQTNVHAALWAWSVLGGIGARTRRGVGSLYCKAFSPTEKDVDGNTVQETQDNLQQWYEKKLQKYGVDFPKNEKGNIVTKTYPLVPTNVWTDGFQNKHIKCWKDCIETLATFRQGANIGRNPGGRTPGRSRWPEPDSIRNLSKQSSTNHKTPITPVNYFPRACFGLPIQFKFNTISAPGDPATYLLEPDKGYDSKESRMASPLLLKPLAISETDSIGLTCNLLTNSLSGLKLKLSPVKHSGPVIRNLGNIFSSELLGYDKSPYKQVREPQKTAGLASKAFIQFFCERGLKK